MRLPHILARQQTVRFLKTYSEDRDFENVNRIDRRGQHKRRISNMVLPAVTVVRRTKRRVNTLRIRVVPRALTRRQP